MAKQCNLLNPARSGYYYSARGESEENPRLMRLLDEQHTRHRFSAVGE
jgi:hypothetical protein